MNLEGVDVSLIPKKTKKAPGPLYSVRIQYVCHPLYLIPILHIRIRTHMPNLAHQNNT